MSSIMFNVVMHTYKRAACFWVVEKENIKHEVDPVPMRQNIKSYRGHSTRHLDFCLNLLVALRPEYICSSLQSRIYANALTGEGETRKKCDHF